MKKYSLILFLFLLLGASGCLKLQGGFTDITETDETGKIIGQTDKSDWVFDSLWTSDEAKLFESVLAPSDSSYKKAYVSLDPAYPNPATGSFILKVVVAEKTIMSYVVVDEQLKIKQPLSSTVLKTGNNLVGFSTNGLTKGNVYRIYFYLSAQNAVGFYKGHGDVKVQ